MKQCRITFLFALLFVLGAYSAETSGTVDANIQFTTYKGEKEDLFELLKSGKHVYVLSYKYPG